MGLYDDMILYGNKQGKINSSLGSTGRNVYSTSSGTPNQQVNSYISANQLNKETRRANAQLANINTAPGVEDGTNKKTGQSSWKGQASAAAIAGVTAGLTTKGDTNTKAHAVGDAIVQSNPYIAMGYQAKAIAEPLVAPKNEYGDYKSSSGETAAGWLKPQHDYMIDAWSGDNQGQTTGSIWGDRALELSAPGASQFIGGLKATFGGKSNKNEMEIKGQQAEEHKRMVAEQERMNAMNNPYSKYETSSAPSGNPYIAARAIVNEKAAQAKNGGPSEYMRSKGYSK